MKKAQPDADILAEDFVETSAGSSDAGRMPVLGDDGNLDWSFNGGMSGGDGSDGVVNLDGTNSYSFLICKKLTIALPTNPTNGQTLSIVVNGSTVAIQFVSSIGVVAGNVLIGASAADTITNLLGLLTSPSTTNSTQRALSAGDQTLINYMSKSALSTTITMLATSASLSTLTGSTTATGGSVTAGVNTTYTMTRDMYATILTVASGITLVTDGFIFNASVECTGAGTIDFGTANNGANGGSSGTTGAAGGASSGTGRFKTTAGGQGGQGALSQNSSGSNAPATTAPTSAIGSSASAVSGGGSDSASPSVGSGVTRPTVKLGSNRFLLSLGLDFTIAGAFVSWKASGQSGAGAGGGSANSGGAVGDGGAGGGASGGIVFGIVKLWSGTFTIKATGGNGGTSGNPNGSAGRQSGPGAGGNGGVSVMVFHKKTWTGSYNLAGGVKGTLLSSPGPYAGAAQDGATGVSYEIQI
ncbi:MAG: hypothetical protein WC763_04780 [Candidatus Paceibacterota bacterium]|jgi:hypothetical protein